MAAFFRNPPRLLRSLWLMMAVGLAIRMVVVAFAYPLQLDPGLDHQEFGYEMGKVAQSLARGQGFSNPLYGPTGPTAWVPPVYPYLMGGVFRVFGIFTAASAIVLLTLNSVFSALTCLPVVAIARRSMGPLTAAWAGWAWALFPYAVYFSAVRVWSYTLAALLIACLFLLGLKLEAATGYRDWILFGAAGGLAALTMPTILATLPFLTLWAIHRRRQRGAPCFRQAALATLLVIAVMSPWMVRNYTVFHRFIPVRDNFWLEFRLDNNGTDDWESHAEHPTTSEVEWRKFQKLGELGYEAERKERSLEYLRAHPWHFAGMSARRFGYLWFGYWSLDRSFLAEEPTAIPNLLMCTVITLLMLKGLRDAFRNKSPAAWPHAWLLLTYLPVYYFTHVKVDFRHPIEPMIVILCVYAFTSGREAAAG